MRRGRRTRLPLAGRGRGGVSVSGQRVGIGSSRGCGSEQAGGLTGAREWGASRGEKRRTREGATLASADSGGSERDQAQKRGGSAARRGPVQEATTGGVFGCWWFGSGAKGPVHAWPGARSTACPKPRLHAPLFIFDFLAWQSLPSSLLLANEALVICQVREAPRVRKTKVVAWSARPSDVRRPRSRSRPSAPVARLRRRDGH